MPGSTDAAPLDVDRLERRLAPLAVGDLRPLTGGASSLTFVGIAGAASGRTRVVVKVAPPGLAPVLHRDVLRQARLLRALRGSAVPVPEVLWEDEGDPPDVPPLFVMTYVEGTSFEPLFDPGHDREEGDEATVAEAARRAARTLAELHALDPAALGLADEPVVGPAGEIDRWCRSLRTVDPALAPGWEEVAKGLAAAAPEAVAPTIVHGDFRLGNLLRDGPRVTAVVDWEIWSVGDPRVDLGWLLTNADPATYRRATRYTATFPSPGELAEEHAGVLGRALPALPWFRALACFKSAATWSLIVKHNRRRHEPEPELEAMAGALPHLLERAIELLS